MCNLTPEGNKIMWKRGEIAPKEQFLLFSTLFYIYIYISNLGQRGEIAKEQFLLFSTLFCYLLR